VLRLRVALAVALGAIATLPGCDQPVSKDECERLLDRYVELLLRGDRPDAGSEELGRVQKEAREKAGQDPAFKSCTSEVSRRQYECAIKAENADRLEQCLL
jgi:hypothetical protein